ncbi:hypothetical protein G0Q06_11765 [Puniceicoccales bacterium CK1056]|uniref:Uncharacterized protein n=1 Tax=Oceanipulchritudo coccoides TaxID=2706888 RepID=A0A6B2M296_9BACT|nr:hypothetical protein [Oceanipulchritudo coccoides]NDV63131.1 hypothetical protein [Oceanipulchritudo coccoides]
MSEDKTQSDYKAVQESIRDISFNLQWGSRIKERTLAAEQLWKIAFSVVTQLDEAKNNPKAAKAVEKVFRQKMLWPVLLTGDKRLDAERLARIRTKKKGPDHDELYQLVGSVIAKFELLRQGEAVLPRESPALLSKIQSMPPLSAKTKAKWKSLIVEKITLMGLKSDAHKPIRMAVDQRAISKLAAKKKARQKKLNDYIAANPCPGFYEEDRIKTWKKEIAQMEVPTDSHRRAALGDLIGEKLEHFIKKV